MTGYRKGLRAEIAAAIFLLLKGYKILERRFRTPVGEIDIVACRGRTLVFVEVKLRKSDRAAAEAVHPENQARVRQAAALYLKKYPFYTAHDMRFDALIFSGRLWPRHITAAF